MKTIRFKKRVSGYATIVFSDFEVTLHDYRVVRRGDRRPKDDPHPVFRRERHYWCDSVREVRSDGTLAGGWEIKPGSKVIEVKQKT